MDGSLLVYDHFMSESYYLRPFFTGSHRYIENWKLTQARNNVVEKFS